MSSNMDLSIIVVNWNSSHYVRKCLESIFRQTKGIEFEVIVIDNASYDGCGQILASEFSDIKFIQSKENLGFASANNLGFDHSQGSNLLFLNPDTEVIGPAINIMFSSLQSIHDAGAVGARLLNTDLSVQTSCIQPFPTILNQVLDFEYLHLRFPKFELWGVKPLFFNNGKPEEVEVICGACIMIKRRVFEMVGMFSEDYFMYTEDIDLCYKIHRGGHKVYYINDATIVHHGGGSSKQSEGNNLNYVLKRESISKFLSKNNGPCTAFLYRFSTALISILRLAVITVCLPVAIMLHRMDTFSPKLTKWVKVLRWSLGLEKWATELNCRRKFSIR
jgi:GT2 family glycosyltransferase